MRAILLPLLLASFCAGASSSQEGGAWRDQVCIIRAQAEIQGAPVLILRCQAIEQAS